MSDAPSCSSLQRGRRLKVYPADGAPPDVITAEHSVSSGRAAEAARETLPELILRDTYGEWRKRRIGNGGAA
jgi:hypothetical protein